MEKCKNCLQLYPIDHFFGKRFKGKTIVKKCIKCRIVDKNGCNARNITKRNLIQTFLLNACAIGKCPAGRKAAECDHIDKTSKLFQLSDYKLYTIEQIIEELKKCQPVCRFCHSIKTKDESYINPLTLSQNPKNILNRKIVIRNKKYVIDQKIKIKKCAICLLEIQNDWLHAFHFDHYENGLITKKK